MLVSVIQTRASRVLRGTLGVAAFVALAALLAPATPAVANGPSSISGAGTGGWTTPPSAEQRTAYSSGPVVAPRAPVTRTPTYVTSSPIAANAGYAANVPPPPPPPPAPANENLGLSTYNAPANGATAPAPTYVGPGSTVTNPCVPCPPVAAPVARPALNPCRLPCEDGISRWHVRGLGGFVTFAGTDPARDCGYWGVDFGRTVCGCWGLDLFYRWNSGQFDRNSANGRLKDGGDWHHFGVKVTYESRIGNSRFFWWAGLGPEYFTTEGYIDDDSGFGIYGEAGIGYLLNQNFRIRAGVGIHGVDTDVTREDPVNDGDSRWLWIFGPHIGVEFDF